MSNILNNDDFGLKLYEKFPFKYREDDEEVNLALKRYMQSLSEGGFKYVIDDINGILTLVDPNKADAKILKILLSQLGLDIFNGIPEDYLRYLIPQINEVWSNKGSIDALNFLAGAVAGIEVTTTITYDEDDNPTANVVLEAGTDVNYLPTIAQMNRIARGVIPFYADVNFLYAFMFYEVAQLNSSDNTLDNIDDIFYQEGLIAKQKYVIFQSNLNVNGLTLNNTFVVSKVESFSPDDPDSVIDVITENGVSRTVEN